MHQTISNMLITKDLDNKVFNYIDPWGENLEYISWMMRAYYHHNIQLTPGQAVFGRDMIFNIESVLDWQAITTVKQQQMDIDNVRENSRQVMHDYAIVDIVYCMDE